MLKVPWLKWIGLVSPLVLFLPIPILLNTAAARCGYTVLIMAVYWTLEILPLPITSLLPLVMFPLLGVASTNTTALVYMKGTQMLYLGSLMIALAVEESGLHRRVALRALLLAGTKPAFLMLGFMIPTALLSMWISNTATAAMMVPIMEAVLLELGLSGKEKTMIMLSVAYSANVGGTGTVIGTPPNIILMEFMNDYNNHPLNFGSWMLFSLPQVFLNLFIVWIVLIIFFLKPNLKNIFKKETNEETPNNKGVKILLQEKYKDLGPMSFHELAVLSLFVGLVVTWFFQKPGFMPGWAECLQWTGVSGLTVKIGSATPTILTVILLFIIPVNPLKDPGGNTLLQWDVVQRKFPWGIILLIGGGFALAEGAKLSCLTYEVGSVLKVLDDLPAALILLILCIVTSIISAIASNAATASMFVPVVLAIASSTNINPLYLSIGVTLTASHAFVLPVSTPPNAIVYISGNLKIKDMALVGIILNIICICSTFLCLHTYGAPMFDLYQFPDWAVQNTTGSTVCQK